MNLKSICGVKCESCLFYKHCGGCSICEGSICNNVCNRCGVLCPKRGSAIIHLKQTLNETITLKGNDRYELSDHIPVFPDRLKSTLNKEIVKIIGVHGGNFLSRNGMKVRKIYSQNGFRKTLNIDDSTKGILQFYVKDKTLEGIWDNRACLYKELSIQGLEAVIAPNFSVYEDAPRMDHLYNIHRSITVYNEMRENGIAAIPDVSWYNINDLDMWVKIINESDIKTIAFSFQVVDVRLKASNAWKNYLAGFRYLCSKILKNIDIIIIGASSPKKAIEISRAKDTNIKLYFLNQSAYIQSQRGMYSEGRARDVLISKEKLLEKNITYFNKLYEDINKGGEE